MIDEEKSMQSTNRREICPQCGTNSDYQTTCCSRLEAALRVVHEAKLFVDHNSVAHPQFTKELADSLLPFRSEEKRR